MITHTYTKTELPDHTCVICKRKFNGFGANPEPVYPFESGVCCPDCDHAVVIPIRFTISELCDDAEANNKAYQDRIKAWDLMFKR